MPIKAFHWKHSYVAVLDQRRLPHQIKHIVCRDPRAVAQVIRDMAVRGAPAIGCVAAYGMVLAGRSHTGTKFQSSLQKAALLLKKARPTAVNLAWAVDRMLKKGEALKNPNFKGLEKEARLIEREDVRINQAMGRYGSRLFKGRSTVLTHCNAGSLATAGHGTALGVIRDLHRKKWIRKVFVDETRPYLQGARLTAWECAQEKIPYELITDNMAAHMMKTEKVDAVIVGCDRVAANGDTANKIGTYSVAVLARYHQIPFYVAMPSSTLDLGLKSGDQIPIEERSSQEVTEIHGGCIAPHKTKARHPAFDVTPASLITAFITEKGVVRPPFSKKFKNMFKS